ncbi:cytochrome C552 [Candidatus Thiomargarita nelsonii]|uniref:Cytochrome C552 n=1 Tax=Candidatus Thiomargarita nelsonii TaxID=1003181 RepID=A0A0A6P4D7_9GAMM|nr:cytochrome C552 [Candidatus Thiomargarita nelsonii]
MIVRKNIITHAAGVALVSLFLLLQSGITNARPTGQVGVDWGEKAGLGCVKCHMTETPGLYHQWNESQHGQSGVNCLDCHQAEKTDKDAFMHEDELISVIVSPKDCSKCHPTEFNEFHRSHHSNAAEILGSLDNLLGEVLGGPEAVTGGCKKCHGNKVEIDEQGKPTLETWPNTGIGRINPDGSRGSCSACHARHSFSRAQARTPDTCGKCHMGPDHPHIEVYNESKHGIMYRANIDKMNLESDKWVVGVDYSVAPTCTTCHMGAAPYIAKTHDVGERISWNLRTPISKKINLIRLDNGYQYDLPEGEPLPKVGEKPNDPKAKGGTVTEVMTWKDRRANMETVCHGCHVSSTVKGHYKQFDDLVNLYNNKFAKPIAAIVEELKKDGHLTAAPFDEKLEWVWWEIWHHEGRRARHGSAMSGPDYTWWHGMYEVVKHTYFSFIPELKKLVGKKEADRLLTKYFKPIEGHAWYFNGLGQEALDEVRQGYEERYGKGSFK